MKWSKFLHISFRSHREKNSSAQWDVTCIWGDRRCDQQDGPPNLQHNNISDNNNNNNMTNWRDDKIYDYLIFTSICTSIKPHHTAILGPVEYPLKGLKKLSPKSQESQRGTDVQIKD